MTTLAPVATATTTRKWLPLAVAAYAAAILAANLMTARMGLVPVGFGMLVTAGTFAAGFALLARDAVQRCGGIRWGLGAIAAGGALSWVFASPQLAIASTVAFIGAELIDFAIYTPLRARRGFATAAVASNIVSAPIDTVLFLALAGFPLTVGAVAGQFVGKVLWATLVPVGLYLIARAATHHLRATQR